MIISTAASSPRISLLLLVILLLTQTNCQLDPETDPSIDFYCGVDWSEANALCSLPCPSGNDTDCPPNEYNLPRNCYASSECFARREQLTWYGLVVLQFERRSHANATGGDVMDDETMKKFENSVRGVVDEALNGMDLDCVEVLGQEYDPPCVLAVLDRNLQSANDALDNNDYYCGTSWFDASEKCLNPCPSQSNDECPSNTKCFAATNCINRPSSTSLVLEVKVCSVYIPQANSILITPSDFENELIDIVSTREEETVSAISASSSFFTALTGVAALSDEAVAETPSTMPSEPPTRPLEVSIETYMDARPSGSYGIFFSIKTLANVTTLVLNGMSFVTPYDGLLEYEVYTKLGEYEGYQGLGYEWEMIASGETMGQGPGKFTPVSKESTGGYLGWTPLHVPGNQGVRSFYLTLTDQYKIEGLQAVPISFSAPIEALNDGQKMYSVITSNEELEIFEGDGVLDYPAPINRKGESDIFYRRPRGFIGEFEYLRDACYPTVDFYGWPCPYVPKGRSPTKSPTGKPISSVESSTSIETKTLIPTDQRTKSPNTEPTSSPIEFSNITVFNDGNQYTIDKNDIHYAQGESLIITDKTKLTLNNGAITAPQNSAWPAIRLSVGSSLIASSGIVQGSDCNDDFDSGGEGIQVNNGQSSPETAGYAEFYEGIKVMGGKGLIGGDALIVNGFGTETVIYGGEFVGGSGEDEDLNGFSVRVINSATVHIHGGMFVGDVSVEGNGIVALHGCFSVKNKRQVTGLFGDDTEVNITIDANGGSIDFVTVPEQECDTAPSVAPTIFPTVSPQPTVQRNEGKMINASLAVIVLMVIFSG